MIEVTRTPTGLIAVRCVPCDIVSFHIDEAEAMNVIDEHEEMHTMTDDLNRYFGLVGASIAWKLSAHFGQLSLG